MEMLPFHGRWNLFYPWQELTDDRDHVEPCPRKVPFHIVLQVATGIVPDGRVLHFGVEVVEHGVQGDVSLSDGFEAQEGVADAAQLARSDEDEGTSARGDVVDGKQLFRQGNHQSAGALHQDDFIATGQFVGGAANFLQVNGSSVYASGQMWRTGIGIDFRGRQSFLVFGQGFDAHQAPVQVDVLGVANVTGLYQFLGDDSQARPLQLLGKPAGAVALSGIRVDAADVVNFVHSIGVK